jgi:hypothetical protein
MMLGEGITLRYRFFWLLYQTTDAKISGIVHYSSNRLVVVGSVSAAILYAKSILCVDMTVAKCSPYHRICHMNRGCGVGRLTEDGSHSQSIYMAIHHSLIRSRLSETSTFPTPFQSPGTVPQSQDFPWMEF